MTNSYVRWAHELLFSIYFPFVVVSAHEGLGQRWAVKFLFFLTSHGYLRASPGIEDYRVNILDFWFVWLAAILIFLFLRMFARFSFTRVILHSFAGLVAIAGFPVATMYVRTGQLFSLGIALILIGMSLVLFLLVYRKWQIPTLLVICLLSFYFVVWATPAAGGTSLRHASLILFWPTWWRGYSIWNYGWLVYPFLGFCSTLLWATYFKQSRLRNAEIQTNELPGGQVTTS